MISLSLADRAFIREHLTDDVRALALGTFSANPDIKKLAAQISSRQKAREKLPHWYENDALVFPPALSVEQASSEQTARYKASLVSGKCLIDLTGGMGVDTWAFAGRVEQVIYVEQNAELAELAMHNLPLLGLSNVTVRTGDGLAFINSLDETDKTIDWVYLDPHRRNAQGGKVVRLADCEPDVSKPGILAALFTRTNRILLKASPLLDIDSATRQLQGRVESVHVVAVQGEVKEILFVLGNQSINLYDITINAVNLTTGGAISFAFQRHEERTAEVSLGEPLRYVYEPNAAMLKAGAFRLAATRFDLKKLAPNSHLYTSETVRPDFPGRIFALQQVIKPDAKAVKQAIPDLKANLTVRNFPQTVAELRKKLSLREGGSIYVLATTLLNGDKRLLITHKVDPTHS